MHTKRSTEHQVMTGQTMQHNMSFWGLRRKITSRKKSTRDRGVRDEAAVWFVVRVDLIPPVRSDRSRAPASSAPARRGGGRRGQCGARGGDAWLRPARGETAAGFRRPGGGGGRRKARAARRAGRRGRRRAEAAGQGRLWRGSEAVERYRAARTRRRWAAAGSRGLSLGSAGRGGGGGAGAT